ncbi:hypothetical protein A8O28_20565 [Enterobacteriaceae bacterium CCUG 67584]|jgi:hypothetical protein|nr:hypothetical protein [Enterobacteriaceae bacterium CCUG 67584]
MPFGRRRAKRYRQSDIVYYPQQLFIVVISGKYKALAGIIFKAQLHAVAVVGIIAVALQVIYIPLY